MEKGGRQMICRNLNNKQEESQFSLSPALYGTLLPTLYGRYQTQMCGERKGERGENNYPLPQPAGLFINTQL